MTEPYRPRRAIEKPDEVDTPSQSSNIASNSSEASVAPVRRAGRGLPIPNYVPDDAAADSTNVRPVRRGLPRNFDDISPVDGLEETAAPPSDQMDELHEVEPSFTTVETASKGVSAFPENDRVDESAVVAPNPPEAGFGPAVDNAAAAMPNGIFRSANPTEATPEASDGASEPPTDDNSEGATSAGEPKRHFPWTVLLVGLLIALLGGGAYAIKYGATPHEVSAPEPSATYSVNPKTEPVTGPKAENKNDAVKVSNVDASIQNGTDNTTNGGGTSGSNNGGKSSGSNSNDDEWVAGGDASDNNSNSQPKAAATTRTISAATMGKQTLFIPAIGAWAPIRATGKFLDSRYKGFETLAIPSNPLRVSWYSPGAPLVGGTVGTTVIAGHVAYNHQWGVLHTLYEVQPGNLAYTSDASGKVQRWKAYRVLTVLHQQFPQEYWPDPVTGKLQGPRRLVVVTCSGAVVNHHYIYNTIVEFAPDN